MPKPPGWIDKVNFIVDYMIMPCDAPAIIYAETALPAAGEAILTLLDFGLDDIVRGYFKPKGLRSGRHGRKGRKGGKRGKGGIPEIGEMIGKNLPGAQAVQGRKVTQGVKNMWIIDGGIQRVLYYFLLVDVVSEFGYAWSSGIMQSAQATCPGRVRGLRSRRNGGPIGAASWNALQFGSLQYLEGDVNMSSNTASTPGERAWVIASGTVKADSGGVDFFTVRIRGTTAGENTMVISQVGAVPPNQSRDFVISAITDTKGGGVAIEYSTNESGLTFETGDFFVTTS